jgi:hypothetical protein
MTSGKYVDLGSAQSYAGHMMQFSQREQRDNQELVILCPAEPTHVYAGSSRGTGREASG